MIDQLWTLLSDLLGLGADTSPTIGQMAIRAVIVYLYALALVRIGDNRFIGKNTAFDVILGFILGSVLSRAVTGNAPFFASLMASTILIAMHWLFAASTLRLRLLSPILKGRKHLLVQDGEIEWDNMRQVDIGEEDLLEAMRTSANIGDLSRIQTAYLERTGSISFIPKEKEARVVDVRVAEGVQTIRIEF